MYSVKLWFYGTLLRSKTIKLQLKNCPAREACELQRLVRVLLVVDVHNICPTQIDPI